jgi:ankyrin repeat protein
MNVATTDENWTALHYASFSGNLDALFTLLRYEADIYAVNTNQLNMLHVAC